MASSNVAVVFRNVHFRYDAKSPEVLTDVSVEIPTGMFVAVIGQNGGGKTTFAKHINGLLKPTAGSVSVYGTDTRERRSDPLSHLVGYCYQNPDHQIFSATVRAEVAFGPTSLGLPIAEVERRTHEAMELVDLTAKAQVHPSLLGRGERQRLAVASVLAMGAEILVVDEPTTGLDYQGVARIMKLLEDWNQRLGRTIIVITHDIRTVADYVPYTIIMAQGQVRYFGATRAALLQDDALDAAAVTPPQTVRVARALSSLGVPSDLVTVSDLVEALRQKVPVGRAQSM
jgi:energy-coupling factor transport system ATP-binding protein